MVDDWVIKTMYATKRRRKNPKSIKPLGVGSRHEQNVKSNPSKRHRERLNSELEHLASLLPFEQNVIVKLDKLSILRLAVSYLRMKCYFQSLSYDRILAENRLVSHLYHCPFDLTRTEGEACLQALNGFIFIMSCDGEVFSVSKTVEHFLGFHQADILHQSALELIHSEDREEFRRQLSWRNGLPLELQSYTLNELMARDFSHHLRRRFTVRFRCLLDNTSGFITLELSGRLQFLHGQARAHLAHAAGIGSQRSHHHAGRMNASGAALGSGTVSGGYSLPPLGLFVVCSPLGPMPSLNGPQRDMTFKTKHQLDFTVLTIDSRTRLLFNYTDTDLQRIKVYDIVHPEDLIYVAQGHREVFKTGSIGLLVHRWLCKSGEWIWLQSLVKMVMKNGKQDHIIAIHRQLSHQEGMELLIRRSDEYKLPFPLLEPETLLSDDNPSNNTRLISEYNGSFTTTQLKEFENNFISSIVNGPAKAGTTARKFDDSLQGITGKLESEYHSSGGDTVNQTNLKRSTSGSRTSREELGVFKPVGHNLAYPYTVPGQVQQPSNPTKAKSQTKPTSGSGRRRKQLSKETIHPEYDHAAGFAYGQKTLPFSLNSDNVAPCAPDYDNLHPSSSSSATYLRPDFYQLEASLRTVNSAGSSFPGHNLSGATPNEFDQVGYYLGWRPTTDHNYLFNSSSSYSQLSHASQPCTADDIGRLFSQENPAHELRNAFVGHTNTDTSYSQYNTPYDAYSAAVAAAAVVAAAANNCHSQATRPHSGTSPKSASYAEATYHRFFGEQSHHHHQTQESYAAGQIAHSSQAARDTNYPQEQHGAEFASPRSRNAAYTATTTIDNECTHNNPYQMLRQTSTETDSRIPAFNRYLKVNDTAEVNSQLTFTSVTDKPLLHPFISPTTLSTVTDLTHSYEPMFPGTETYGDSFGEKPYQGHPAPVGLRNVLTSSLANTTPDLQTAQTLLYRKPALDGGWTETEANRSGGEDAYFRTTAPEDLMVANRSTSSACSSSSGRSRSPEHSSDREFPRRSATKSNPIEPRWDQNSNIQAGVAGFANSPRIDSRNTLPGLGQKRPGSVMARPARDFDDLITSFESTDQSKKHSNLLATSITHSNDESLRIASSALPMTNLNEVNAPVTNFRESLMGLI